MLKKECFPNRSIVSSLKTWEPKIQIIKLKIFMYAEKNQRQLIKLKIFDITLGNLDSSWVGSPLPWSAYISIQIVPWNDDIIQRLTYISIQCPILKHYRVKHKGWDYKDDFKL